MNEPMKSSFSQGIFDISATKREILGTLRILADGRKFRYCRAGAADLHPGMFGQAGVDADNHINVSVAAAAIGDTEVAVTVGATAVTENQYEDGYLQVNDGTGQGHQYRILGNTACATSGVTYVTLNEPIKVALVASATSEVSLLPSEYSAVVESATEETMPVGVAPCAVTTLYYYWAQTAGPAIVLMDGTPAVASMLVPGAVAGSLKVMNATLDIDMPYVALKSLNAGVDTEYKPVKLLLD